MMAETIKHLTSSTLKGKRTFEIVVVDDGSSDGTSAAALKLAKAYPTCDIKVVTLENNIGKGGAVRHGMLFSGGERLLMADADGASRIEDLEELWKSMDAIAPNKAPGMVVGSRAHLVKTEAVVKVGYPWRNILVHLIYGLTDFLSYRGHSYGTCLCTASIPSSGS
jgi:dolichyl-phosphate beta-glucosyltransferase